MLEIKGLLSQTENGPEWDEWNGVQTDEPGETLIGLFKSLVSCMNFVRIQLAFLETYLSCCVEEVNIHILAVHFHVMPPSRLCKETAFVIA